jgi:hypothetical protein
MNLQNIPLNTAKFYITITLMGGCDLFVPIKEGATELEVDMIREELKGFADWQRWATTPEGDNIA